MAQRTTKVRLTAQVQEYIEGMEKAAKATRETGSEAEKLTQQREAFERLGMASMAIGAAAAAGVALAISKWADFDQAMSNVQAATMESETNMKRLSEAALEAGARTVFSAEESANAIEELAKAGVSTADILNGALDGALDLAAAGGLGVAEAAGIAATALKTFNLEGSDMAHVADLLAAGAGKAMGDVTDLSAALNQSAMVANATGLTIEETTAALSAFASQGLLGSDAGTSFKAMLQSLTPTSAKARETMDSLGISAYDAQGNFVGLTEFAGSLQAGLKDLSVEQQQAALKTIFGSDAIRAATVLYSEGADGIQDWIDAVDDQGYAAEQAAARLDNLKGDLEALGGALDTALIKTGESADGVLRDMVQRVTEMIDAYNDLPAPLQSATMAAGALAAAIGLIGGAILIGIPKYAEFRKAMDTLELSGGRLERTLSAVGKGVGVAAAWGTLILLAREAEMDITALTNSFERNASATEAVALAADAVGTRGWGDAINGLREFKVSSDDVTAALDRMNKGWFEQTFLSGSGTELAQLGNTGDALKAVGDGLAEIASVDLSSAQDSMAKLAKEYSLSDEQMIAFINNSPALKRALEAQAGALGLTTDGTDLLKIALGEIKPASDDAARASEKNADALAELEGKATSTTDGVDALADAIRNFGAAQFDVREASRQLEDSVAGLNEKLTENGLNLDITTEAGRQTEAAIDDMAQSVLEQAAAIAIQTGDQEAANAALETGRQRLIDMLAPFYGSREAAQAYVDTLGLTPENLTTAVSVSGIAEAEAALANLARTREATINVATKVATDALAVFASLSSANGNMVAYANGGIAEFASGGFPTGIYSGGAPIHKFAEPETGWEAYISGKPSERDRNRQIWVDAGERLGLGDVIKALSAGGGSGGTTVHQKVAITQVERDPRLVARQLGREIRGALG